MGFHKPLALRPAISGGGPPWPRGGWCSGFELLDLGICFGIDVSKRYQLPGTQVVRNGRKNTLYIIYHISIWMFLKIGVPQNGW